MDQRHQPAENSDATFALEPTDLAGLASSIHRLSAGMCGAVALRGLVPDTLTERLRDIDSLPFEYYDPGRLDPPILKVGPALYDHYLGNGVDESYWDAADRADRQLSAVFAGTNPVADIVTRLAQAVHAPVNPARINGRPLHVGILREFPIASKIHYDELVREYPGHLDVEPIVQLAFNLHVLTPDRGGALTVWKHRWIPDDDRATDGYGWREDVVASAPSVTVRAAQGDAVIFDCRNLHRVGAFTGGRRITLSFFVGFTVNDGLIVWS